MSDHVTLEIHRRCGDRRWVERYAVPYDSRMNLLSALHRIYTEMDPTLCFRVEQCTRGICDVCQVRVNGKKVKACSTPVYPGQHLVVEPANNRVVRDLVTEQD